MTLFTQGVNFWTYFVDEMTVEDLAVSKIFCGRVTG